MGIEDKLREAGDFIKKRQYDLGVFYTPQNMGIFYTYISERRVAKSKVVKPVGFGEDSDLAHSIISAYEQAKVKSDE